MQENTKITHYLYDTDCIKEEDMDISEGLHNQKWTITIPKKRCHLQKTTASWVKKGHRKKQTLVTGIEAEHGWLHLEQASATSFCLDASLRAQE